jgi:hypothetical protein
MFKKIAVITLSIIIFYSCNTDKDNMIIIRDHVQDCTRDLVDSQLEKGVRKKDYDFKGQEFTLYIDSTGKPIFLNNDKPCNSLSFKFDEEFYNVELKDGLIRVSRE